MTILACCKNVIKGISSIIRVFLHDRTFEPVFPHVRTFEPHHTSSLNERRLSTDWMSESDVISISTDESMPASTRTRFTVDHSLPLKESGESNYRESNYRGVEMAGVGNFVVGLHNDWTEILDWLTGDKCDLDSVTIVGMGGIGKTTLAKSLFDSPLVRHRFDIRAWITVTQVYLVGDLLRSLLQTIGHLDNEIINSKNDRQLAEVLYRRLKGQRFLIVIDDIWSNKAWDDMRRSFPDDKIGSRILLTSRLTDLAFYVNPRNPPHQMSFLNEDESWELLNHELQSRKSRPPELVHTGKRIAGKCQGLPLTVLVVAGLLSNISQTQDCWENVAQNMSSIVSSGSEHCLAILAMSYNYLSNHLKACFLYMSAFPEDTEIEAWRLIRLWVAEGFIEPVCSKSLEQVAEEYLEDLICRSLVLVGKRRVNGKVKTCRIHDLLRDLSLREARKEDFMHVITSHVQFSPDGLGSMRRLSYHSGNCSEIYSQSFIQFTRSFLCFNVGAGDVQDFRFFLLNFKLLRVLDIGFLRFDFFPIPLLKLIHLRFLALTAACQLPSSISRLWNLQTLSVYGPWIGKRLGECPALPPEIWKMSQLRHINLTAATCLPDPLREEDEGRHSLILENLQTLSKIRTTSCTKEVFNSLPNLQKLVIHETKEDIDTYDGSFDFAENVSGLHCLQTLKCFFYLRYRKTLHLLDRNPFPPGLKKLTLSGSYLPWEDMEKLGRLPYLEELKLKNYAFQGSIWELNEVQFVKLKLLLLDKTDLVHWDAYKNNFPCLQHLILKHCEALEEISYSIADDLQLLELHYCSFSAERSARNIQEEQKSLGNDGLEVHILTNA